ncbi:MAG TPA: response regulator transcription factor [Coleofasciculaceae cyanobacterium]|jgi:DNA-binding NarL/FixJ family response regulator
MTSTQATPRQLRVLIVEDHELARFGLSMALSERENIVVVGEAENGRQGVDLAMAEKPDIILMDIGMPVMDGISATHEIKAKMPEVHVVMLTSISNQEEVMASLAAGADAYCMKEIKIDRLHQVLDMIVEGAIWLDPAIARIVMQQLPGNGDGTSHDEPTATGHHKRRYNTELTDREREVLQLIVSGKSNKEIALALNVSNHTAKAHVGNIIQKLAVDDRTQVAVKALKEGLL